VTRPLLERDLAGILELALREAGARYYHTHDSRRSAEGWPDYVISIELDDAGQLLFCEIKKAGGCPTIPQAEWLLAIARARQPAILAGGAAGISSVIDLVRGIAKGRRIAPTALGRVLVFGDVSPLGRELVGAVADDSTPRRPHTPDIRRRRRGW
jgi:hypothetical protein